MVAERKSVRLREKIEEQKQHIFELAEKHQEQLIFERLTQEQRDQLDEILHSYQRNYGVVAYQYWLRAVVRSMKPNMKHLNQVLVYELQSRTSSDAQKQRFLNVMAKQMGLDVTIKNNRVPKPGKKSKVIPSRISYHDN
jgi:hypothetical protein